ncbi:hypothetical protein EV179_001076 [Coemansia sp. RSA 487]|nr:hypothetical protein EV179_001076 [Coemansia sp. RSA 487]
MFGSINSSGAIIDGIEKGEASDILLPNQSGRVQKVAVDIGGSLAKVVYLTSGPHNEGGRLHFTAFETDNVEKCAAFIRSLLRTNETVAAEIGDRHGSINGSCEPPLITADSTSSQEGGSEYSDGSTYSDAGDHHGPVVVATGGGAHRFRDLLQRELGVEIRIEDEMESLTTGLNFLMREVADEVFTYSEDRPMQFVTSAPDDMFPYMLVNIGSGVSIIKVTGEGTYERISGTSLGGGTLWGLLHLLTGVRSFDAMLDMTKSGDNTKVDMMVGDIYGTNYDKIGLKATNIASTMAGVYRKSLDKQYSDADIARSLLYMVSNNIGQIAYLNAQLHGIRRIYFGGYFIRGHPLTMHTLSYAINFWSKGEMSALFLRHEGFLGAAGAFFIDEQKQQKDTVASSVPLLGSKTPSENVQEDASRSAVAVAEGIALEMSSPAPGDLANNVAPAAAISSQQQPQTQRRFSSRKKRASDSASALRPGTSSGSQLLQPSPPPAPGVSGPGTATGSSRRSKSYSFTENFSITETIADEAVSSLGMLDRQPAKLLSLPQLINSSIAPYQPDTVDLSKDLKQQEYWITAMERNTHGLLDLADNGTLANDEAARQKMSSFVTLYLSHLRRLRDRPLAYGPMSVRTLLGLREQCLHEVGLEDIFAQVKSRETDAALMALPTMLAQTDRIDDTAERLRVLVHNVLAGNMFDWGSTDLRDKLADGSLGFDQAKQKITWQPQFDSTNEFVEAVVNRRVLYRKAVVFVDNSGADVCLGVLPFARFLLSFVGSKVILASNSRPALNDVTERELADIVRRAAREDEEISRAVSSRQLLVCGTGCSGPCLDLRKLDERLVRHCHNADLVVIVGMGRAIHSNYHARFVCDSLKLAVFKNKMAADAAHANIYDGLSLFVPGELNTAFV